MDISRHVTPDRVVLLESERKDDALDELIAVMTASEPAIDRAALADAVRKREALMSTGVGAGLAIPHVRMAGVPNPIMAVGVRSAGIPDYESLDDQPVRILLLIAAPQGQHEAYIRLLAGVTRVLKRPEHRQAVLDAEDAERVDHVLTEAGG